LQGEVSLAVQGGGDGLLALFDQCSQRALEVGR
jgi:hypothetical protein